MMATADDNEVHFEAALSQIESIVDSLERGEPDLAAALSKYETGVRLLNRCYTILEQAERSVALLAGVDSKGRPETRPFDASATLNPAAEPVSKPGSSAPQDRSRPTADPAQSTAVDPKPSRSRRVKPPLDEDQDLLDPPF